MTNRKSLKIISLILVLSMIFSLVACSSKPTESTRFTLSDPNSEILTEHIETENVITEEMIYEHITEENYLTELVIVEDQVTELLLQEDIINEVVLCEVIYVSEDRIDEFAENSQTDCLFGENVDWSALLKKVAVGTGVIVTLVVLKRVGLPDPICSVVVGAADKALEFSAAGAAIGSVYGGATGASDEIDQSGRTSAVIGVAAAVAGLIISAVSLVAEIPSGGLSNVTLATGIKLVIAGIGVIAGTVATVAEGIDCIQTFTATDGVDIDWDNIDWDEVGCAAAERAIENAGDGYMWGAVVGAVYGGAEGYEFFHKYHTPYSSYNARLVQTPAEGGHGHWTGERGESTFILDEPIVLPDGTEITQVTYTNCVPDFSPYAEAEVNIPNMTNVRRGTGKNFEQADEALAELWNSIRHNGRSWTADDVRAYREANNLVWHEMNNMESMQLVPYDVNDQFGHLGGVGEYNAMIGQEGVEEFD